VHVGAAVPTDADQLASDWKAGPLTHRTIVRSVPTATQPLVRWVVELPVFVDDPAAGVFVAP